MVILFSHTNIVQSERFAEGVYANEFSRRDEFADQLPFAPADRPMRAGHSATDAAWHSGFTARYESPYGELVRPPADLSTAEVASWLEGSAWGLEQLESDMDAAWDAQNETDEDAARYADWVAWTGGAD